VGHYPRNTTLRQYLFRTPLDSGGGSKFTYQLFGGLGYNLNKKVALVVGYRDLDVNYDKNNFVFDMSQRGPIMGVGFKF
jgi:opacity protein-like surface antigen